VCPPLALTPLFPRLATLPAACPAARRQVVELLESLGAPVYGFELDDAAARDGGTSRSCRSWPGYAQADQMRQCWSMVTKIEASHG